MPGTFLEMSTYCKLSLAGTVKGEVSAAMLILSSGSCSGSGSICAMVRKSGGMFGTFFEIRRCCKFSLAGSARGGVGGGVIGATLTAPIGAWSDAGSGCAVVIEGGGVPAGVFFETSIFCKFSFADSDKMMRA